MTWRRWVLSGGAVAIVAIVVAAVLVLRDSPASDGASGSAGSDSDLDAVVTRYLAAWSAGDVTTAGSLTDAPQDAVEKLKQVRHNLTVDPATTVRQVSGQSATFGVSWTVPGAGVWSYDGGLSLVQSETRWLVHWTPEVVHPQLTNDRALVLRSTKGGNAVVDRDGKPLLTWQHDQPQPVDPKVAPLLLPALGRVATDHVDKGKYVVLVDPNGTEQVLFGDEQADSGPLTTTLSSQTQAAAQAAVDSAGSPAMLVAIQPSTGDVLAVAQNAAAGSANPLNGLYAPGSTFKIATATAVLETGTATVDTVEPCPSTVQIGQRTIPNDDGFSFPPLPLHSAFAHSCNTTFAQLASGLPASALADAADQLGVNADFDIPGITTEAGKVVAAKSPAEQVESAIGQGTVQVSPFGLALMAATVAGGHAVTPRLWHGLDTTVNTSYQAPPSGVINALRSMMREVVTAGTATGLRGSGQVYGKTGTAQFGDGSQANGWFIGYRGDVAFAVLLLGSNSSKPAVSVAAAFLR
ncbi:penicillin-binding transpeptidase domain-containing protein [Amycolatopsis taiwanensis]|uniref:penicillin-binding transpeptidase domain-containing protein n=1 Tax=Amycolatopsis taiwanensis TaxID=342230 RepID=UPI0004B399DA|nr:penicillin-binding transpeptidase domain-containing protein [Amycolatopsis taiwanensis]